MVLHLGHRNIVIKHWKTKAQIISVIISAILRNREELTDYLI